MSVDFPLEVPIGDHGDEGGARKGMVGGKGCGGKEGLCGMGWGGVGRQGIGLVGVLAEGGDGGSGKEMGERDHGGAGMG